MTCPSSKPLLRVERNFHSPIGEVGTCSTSCLPNSFQSGSKCFTCDFSCSGCTGVAPKDCTNCNSSYYKLTVSGVQTCVLVCPQGYFQDTISGVKVCTMCIQNCTSCTSLTNCISCQVTHALRTQIISAVTYQECILVANCNLSPDFGEFLTQNSNSFKVCNACPEKCLKCTSLDICTDCRSTFLLRNNQCQGSCSTNQFRNLGTALCQDCPTGCTECVSDSVCTACDTLTHIKIGSQCFAKCPTNQYITGLGTCLDCPSTCSTCTSPTACTSCPVGRFLIKGRCDTDCPLNFFFKNTVDRVC